MEGICQRIEERIQRDKGNRGIKSLIPASPQIFPACSHLLTCQTVGILTGFPCLFNNPIKIETDGLAGALALSRSLHSLGISSIILIDKDFLPIIQPLISYHNSEFSYQTGLSSSLSLSFDGIISIERAGRAEDGNYYTMRALKMHNITEFDTVYMDSQACKVKVAIGDGGNEAGLGPVKEKVKEFIKNGQIIASCSYSDYVIISSVSTWGGYALANCLCLVGGESGVVSENSEEKVTRKIMEIGVCDGITGIPSMGVDGLRWEDTAEFIRDIVQIGRGE